MGREMGLRSVAVLAALVGASRGAALTGGSLTRRTLSSAWASDHRGWTDVTALVEGALPPLPAALCHLRVPDGTHVALVDPNLLEALGRERGLDIAAHGRPALSLAVHQGRPLLPDGARVVLMRADPAVAAATEVDFELAVEASEALSASAQPPVQEALARATLRAALSVLDVTPDELDGLDAAQTSAGKVFGSFVGGGGATGRGGVIPRGEALEAAARRTAHHIAHLLRADRAAAAAYLRNSDPAEAPAEARPAHRIHLVLDNVRSAYNVGSLFRTADTANVAEVVTCGFTPHPPHPKLAKTGFGALESVATRHFDTTLAAVAALRAEGIAIICMETTEHAHNYVEHRYAPGGVALVLGNEEIGVDTRVLSAADATVEIPTFGRKNSLNIAAAAPVVMFEVLRQWGKLGEAPAPPPAAGLEQVRAAHTSGSAEPEADRGQ